MSRLVRIGGLSAGHLVPVLYDGAYANSGSLQPWLPVDIAAQDGRDDVEIISTAAERAIAEDIVADPRFDLVRFAAVEDIAQENASAEQVIGIVGLRRNLELSSTDVSSRSILGRLMPSRRVHFLGRGAVFSSVFINKECVTDPTRELAEVCRQAKGLLDPGELLWTVVYTTAPGFVDTALCLAGFVPLGGLRRYSAGKSPDPTQLEGQLYAHDAMEAVGNTT